MYACVCVQDAQPIVREAAAKALTQLADHLQPDILQHHETVIPALFEGLETSREPVVISKTIVALEIFLNEMEADKVAPYAQPVMQKLLQLLQVPDRTVQVPIGMHCLSVFHWAWTENLMKLLFVMVVIRTFLFFSLIFPYHPPLSSLNLSEWSYRRSEHWHRQPKLDLRLSWTPCCPFSEMP